MRKLFGYIHEDQINLSMAYIAYTGEMLIIDGKESIEEKMLKDIRKNIASVKELCFKGNPDWEVIWGPAIYTFSEALFQSNMMYVVRQISNPSNLIIAIRGTNIPSIIDWIKEDFDVWKQVDWVIPEEMEYSTDKTPKISKSTDRGLDIVVNKLIPAKNIPGEGMGIVDFLKEVTEEKCRITITGHSLGGALTSALALYLKERQKDWDKSGETEINLSTFASPTIGNSAFAGYFDSQLADKSRRIWNTLDIIPHAWEADGLSKLPDIYSEAGISIPWSLDAVLKVVEVTVPEYEHVSRSESFTWRIKESDADYVPQAFDQHAYSYPEALELPVLIDIFKENIPGILSKSSEEEEPEIDSVTQASKNIEEE